MIILQFSAALGPLECRLALFKILPIFLKEAEGEALKCEFLDLINQEGEIEGTIIGEIFRQNPLKNPDKLPKSLTLAIEGEEIRLRQFLSHWEGTILWICASPFRPNHRRKNWFIGIKQLKIPEKAQILEKDLKYETIHASGAGGQHINKTNSAVRLTYIPTGLSVRVENFRSQQQNKKLALLLLYAKLEQENLYLEKEVNKEKNQHHYNIERGNPKKIFKGINCVEDLS